MILGGLEGAAIGWVITEVMNKLREWRDIGQISQVFKDAFTESGNSDGIVLVLCNDCEAFRKQIFMLADNQVPDLEKVLDAAKSFITEKGWADIDEAKIVTALKRFSTSLINHYIKKGHKKFGDHPANFITFDRNIDIYILKSGIQLPPPPEAPQDDKPYFIVPHLRNSLLRHAEGWIEQIHDALAKEGKAAVGQTIALKGQGGIGKTAMAVEYAYRYRDEYPGGVYWLQMDRGIGAAASDFLEAAPNYGMDFGNWQYLEESQRVSKVISFLNRGPLKLVIPDNVESDTLPKELNIPDAHLLVTTRRSTLPLPLIGMVLPEEEEALKIFLAYANMEGKEISEEEHAAAIDICRRVDRLPLALEIMGQIARRRPLFDVAEQLPETIVKRKESTALKERTTILAALRLAEQEFKHLLSREGMIVAAYLHPENLDRNIMAGVLGIKEKKADTVLDDLSRLAVVEMGTQAYSVHRLTQEAARSMDDGQKIGLKVAEYLNERIEAVSEKGEYLNAYHLVPHLVHLASLADENAAIEEFPSELLVSRWERYLIEAGQYEQTEALNQICLARVETAKGKDHPEYSLILNNLAGVLHRQGRYEEAEGIFRKVLALDEQRIGKEHSDYAIGLNNLAIVVEAQGRYEESEEIFRMALKISKKTLGPDHPFFFGGLNNLAGVILSQGRYKEAKDLYRQALSIAERTIGTDHPDYATQLSNLANVVRSQGRYEEAVGLYRQALEIDERTIGTGHPQYSIHVNNLAETLRAQGRYKEAEGLFRETLAIDERTIGLNHPSYALSLNNLAETLRAQGRYKEAEGLFREALAIDERTIGLNHPYYAISLNNLAVVVRSQGRYEEAEELLRQALEISEKRLGPDHPQTETIRKNYEILLTEMKQE